MMIVMLRVIWLTLMQNMILVFLGDWNEANVRFKVFADKACTLRTNFSHLKYQMLTAAANDFRRKEQKIKI